MGRKKRAFLDSDSGPVSVLGKRIQHEYFPDVEVEDLGIDFNQIKSGVHRISIKYLTLLRITQKIPLPLLFRFGAWSSDAMAVYGNKKSERAL